MKYDEDMLSCSGVGAGAASEESGQKGMANERPQQVESDTLCIDIVDGRCEPS